MAQARKPRKQKASDKPKPDLVEHSEQAETARQVIKVLGLDEPDAPSDGHRAVQFPQDLSQISSEELGYQMTVWNGMLNYASYQKSLIEIDRDHYEGVVDRKVEDHVDSEKNRDVTITEKKMAARRKPEVRQILDKSETGKAVLRLLSSLAEGFERNYAAVSREISRRGVPAADS